MAEDGLEESEALSQCFRRGEVRKVQFNLLPLDSAEHAGAHLFFLFPTLRYRSIYPITPSASQLHYSSE